jgi:phospholipase/lecithinase/hemolysin
MLIEWNKQLAAYCERFKESHPDTAILEFSSWDVFNELFDDPDKFGFDKEDVGRRSGAMFVDHIHPTSRVHNVFAEAIGRWLESL